MLGVTVLTSLDLSDLGEVGVITNNVASVVQQRALLCQEAGLDGVVASPEEVALLRRACGPDFLLVTPGVRPAGTADGDQKRTGLVAQTIRDGADLIVIGRPLREARDPRAAAAAIIAEIAQSAALERRPAP